MFAVGDRNRVMDSRRFEYRRCGACGVVWLSDPPSDLAAYYPGDYHDLPDAATLAREASHQNERLALFRRHAEPGRLVEIGPSHGAFAWAAKSAGFDVVGLEMDARCCVHLQRVVGVQAVQTQAPAVELRTLPPSQAVVMFHVVEHLPDPWTTLRAVADNLVQGGVLVLATPNPHSLQFRLLGRRWVHLDAPRHLTLIPLPALRDEAAGLGLSLVESTATDRIGLECNRLGWERSLLAPPQLRPDPVLAHTIGRILTRATSRLEQRGLRGSTYTAAFRKA
jgi:hypothetical protein